MKNSVIKLLVLIIISNSALSQGQNAENQNKNYTMFQGKVINEETNEPLEAKVTFERQPHGSDIGFITSDKKEGSFEFYMRGNSSYTVKVTAKGFFPYVEVFDPAQEPVISREINLKPGGVGHVIRLEKLIFEQGKADITRDSYVELDKLVILMEDNPNMVVQLEGHTDYRGSAAANMRLSEMRVQAVKSYLIRNKINEDRILTKAFGGTQPLTRENDPEARASNRRVEVRIIKN